MDRTREMFNQQRNFCSQLERVKEPRVKGSFPSRILFANGKAISEALSSISFVWSKLNPPLINFIRARLLDRAGRLNVYYDTSETALSYLFIRSRNNSFELQELGSDFWKRGVLNEPAKIAGSDPKSGLYDFYVDLEIFTTGRRAGRQTGIRLPSFVARGIWMNLLFSSGEIACEEF